MFQYICLYYIGERNYSEKVWHVEIITYKSLEEIEFVSFADDSVGKWEFTFFKYIEEISLQLIFAKYDIKLNYLKNEMKTFYMNLAVTVVINWKIMNPFTLMADYKFYNPPTRSYYFEIVNSELKIVGWIIGRYF